MHPFSHLLGPPAEPPPPQASRLTDWDEASTRFDPPLFLRAATWKPFTLYDLPAGEEKCFGKWRYKHKVWPKGKALNLCQGTRRGRVWFDDEVVIPVVSEKVREEWETWMSYTPQEVMTQRRGLKMARGKVFIGGLGMGWLANRVAARKQVTEVVVVEREADVIELARPACTSPKVHVVKGDAWEEARRHGDDWTFLFDTFLSYGWNDDDPKVREFRKARPDARTWCWGGGAGPG